MEFPICTERLSIQPLSLSDADFIIDLMNTPTWLKAIGDRQIHTVNDAREYLRNGPIAMQRRNGFSLYRVSLLIEETPIGICGLIKRDSLPEVDLGFAFLPDYEGLGYAFESAQAVMEYAEKQLALSRLVAIANPSNIRSIKLLERLGMQFEKEITLADSPEVVLLYGKNWTIN